MSGAEKVQDVMKKFSDQNIDSLIKATTFNEKLEDAIREHIQLEWKTWFFYRKLGNDCLRSNVALHGFAR